MRRRRSLGLQGWLVGALLAVGMAASLSVLLVVLPTLESSVRSDRAKRDAQTLQRAVVATAREAERGLPAEARLRGLADRLRGSTGAEVRIRYRGPGGPGTVAIDVVTPADATLLRDLPTLVPGRAVVLRDDTVVAAAAQVDGGIGSGSISAARAVTGLAPELAIIRRRVILAMIVVLGLAALAGVALANVIGGRIRRLATTSAALAAGDLSARAPRPGVAPEEIVTLGESLNGMAARLQSLVDELRGERDRDRAMIGSLAEGVLTVAGDGTVTVANDAAARLLRLPGGAEPARLDALPPAVLDAVLAARAAAAGPVERRLVELPDGAELELHVTALADDGAGGTVLTLRDVTEQRRLERARRDLVANVSHELKTPIAALKGFLELLEDGSVDERHRREFLVAMIGETSRLERLVEEQLQLARLDAGAVPLELQRVDLNDVAEVVAAPRIPLAARDGVELSVARAVGGEVPAHVDPARIEQILLILLDNAQRHTPPGGRVEVLVGRDGAEATITVRDTGEGIAEEDQPFVFDRFYRADASREGRSAGLGLAIARGLAAAHGGSIALESRLGEGSAFTLRLPLGAPARGVAFAP